MSKRKSDEFGWSLSMSQFDEDEERTTQQMLKNGSQENESFVEKRIRKVIETTFDEEINYKKFELEKINERIFEAQNMLDKLRVCIICSYYSQGGRLTQAEYINHPAIKALKCEHLDMAIAHAKSIESENFALSNKDSNGFFNPSSQNESTNQTTATIESMNSSEINSVQMSYTQQYEVKICVGNVSKYIVGESNSSSEALLSQGLKPPTHKWMVYIRSPQCARLEAYIKKVIYFLHSSYKPNDIVEIKSPPFEITRRGWGEFPIQVQIHFKDPRNKRVDVMHAIKLDWTQTGLQTFGGETSASAKLILKPADFILTNSSNTPTVSTTTSITNTTQPESMASYKPSQINRDNEEKIEDIPMNSTDTASSMSSLSSSSQSAAHDNRSETNLAKTTTTVIETIPIKTNQDRVEDVKPSISQLISNVKIVPTTTTKISTQKVTAGPFSSIVDKPAEVIYKIQPSDVNKPKTSSSNFLSSLKPTGVSVVQTTSIVKPNNSISTVAKVVVDQSTIKRIKLSADQLTKIKGSSTSQPDVVVKKEPITCEQTPQLIVAQETVVTTKEENDQEEENSLTYSIESVKRHIKKNTHNTSFEMALKRCLPDCPLILDATFGRHNQEEKNHRTLDLCAQSLHDYYTWPCAKRKAREWMRAVRLKELAAASNPPPPIWSTKRIVLWLRSHGYTPLEYKNILNPDSSLADQESPGYVSSFTPVNRLFPFKEISDSSSKQNNQDEDDEDLDVVSNKESRFKSGVYRKREEEQERNVIDVRNFIEMSPAERYIQEELFKLQIKTNPVNLVLSSKPGNSESVFGCNLVEKFLLSLFKRFADDIIRQTCSDIYFDSSNSTSTLNKTTSSIDCCAESTSNKRAQISSNSQQPNNDAVQKFPLYLGVKDVYKTLVTHDRFDFLTNKYMGAYKATADPSFISNTNRIKLKKNYSDSSLVNK